MQINQLVTNVQHFLVKSTMNLHGDQSEQRRCKVLRNIVDNQNLSKANAKLKVVSETLIVLI